MEKKKTKKLRASNGKIAISNCYFIQSLVTSPSKKKNVIEKTQIHEIVKIKVYFIVPVFYKRIKWIIHEFDRKLRNK